MLQLDHMTVVRSPKKFEAYPQRSRTAILIRFAAFFLCIFAVGGLVATLLVAPKYVRLDPASSAGITSDQKEQQSEKLINLQTSMFTASPSRPLPTVTNTIIPTVVPTAVKDGCISWTDVTLADVGKEICVQGTYLREETRQDGVRIMIFGDNAAAFQVWSSKRPFSWYLKRDTTSCMLFKGLILTTGVRPIMILRSNSKVEACQ
jgi:hypothetical protein